MEAAWQEETGSLITDYPNIYSANRAVSIGALNCYGNHIGSEQRKQSELKMIISRNHSGSCGIPRRGVCLTDTSYGSEANLFGSLSKEHSISVVMSCLWNALPVSTTIPMFATQLGSLASGERGYRQWTISYAMLTQWQFNECPGSLSTRRTTLEWPQMAFATLTFGTWHMWQGPETDSSGQQLRTIQNHILPPLDTLEAFSPYQERQFA